ncbi:T9SS type A sorting domain-containing protein [Hymenobacter sp. B81]|uniref:T9SS type A sorting domain-containing protein n=1 Tax=Hymenobacter sp. B81 TaxID=3344878 RepID=UPI0037DD637B
MSNLSSPAHSSRARRFFCLLGWLPVLLLALGLAPAAQAQTCNLYFETQAAVDSYVASGVRCPTAQSLFIRGFIRNSDGSTNGGVSDISGLLHITAVTQGVLVVMGEMSSLAGLANIQNIGGGLTIQGVIAPTALNAFPNLQRVGGTVGITLSPGLTGIAGFGRLQSVQSITIHDCLNLVSIAGFGALTTAEYISISSMPALRSISGFGNLHTITGPTPGVSNALGISYNPVLETIPAFPTLASVGSISITANPRLQTVVGFDGLRSASYINIGENTALHTISGFNGPLVVTPIGGSYGHINIGQNSALETLAGFDGLEALHVNIGNNPRLRDIASFNNSKLNGQLSVYDNAGLEKITGFRSLRGVQDVSISRNAVLDSISGITGSAAPRGIFIQDNPTLRTLTPGLAFADYSALNFLYLLNNSSLAGCNVSWICQYLARGGSANISGNAPSCTYAAIQQGCASAPTNDLVVAGSQSISGSYRNVTVTGTGVATLSGPLTVAGTLAVQSGGTLVTNCQPLTGPGNFFLLSGGRLNVCAPAGLATAGASGAVQLTGTRSFSADADYAYTGTQAQATGNGLPPVVRRLALDNPAGLTLSQPLAVTQLLTLTAGTLSTSGQMLTLRSDSAGTAMVVNDGGVVQGAATVQRYVSGTVNPGRGYRHFSAPVSNTTVSDLATAGFAPVVNLAYNSSATPNLVTPFPTVFGYDQSRLSLSNNLSAFDKGWVSPASLGSPLQVGRGYTVNLPAAQTVDFVGSLNNGNVAQSLARGPQADAGWHLVGNPYPAPLDWSRVAPADRNGLTGAVYVFQSASQYGGSYRAYVNGIGNPVVALGQGFFVRVADTAASATLTLRNAHRLTSPAAQPAFQRGPLADPRTRVELTLRNSAGSLADATYVYFEAGATAGVDAQYDAYQLPNTTGLALASLAGPTALSINGLPLLAAQTVVPLQVRVPAAGSYTLHATELLNLATTELYLVDAVTGQQVNLRQQPQYAFAAPAAAQPGRFTLRFTPSAIAAARPGSWAAGLALYPNPARQQATLLLPAVAGAKQAEAVLYNALGQPVRRLAAALGTTTGLDLTGLAAGVYTLRVQAGAETATKRLVVE